MDTLFATTKPHYINVKKVDVTEISHIHLIWLREPDLNRRPSGYEPDELPSCSIPRYTTLLFFYSFIIIALCKGCVNSFLHIFLFYALSGFFD